MDDETRRNYDLLASAYHLIFADWELAIDRHAAVLDVLLRDVSRRKPLRILDSACGIGTQALGLARLGHNVTGVDISEDSIVRAMDEARQRRLDVAFAVGDMRDLSTVSGPFDVVIAMDNALPHLSKPDLCKALRSMASKLEPDGVLMVSIRDYEEALRTRPSLVTPVFYDGPEGRRIVHQVWEWLDSRRYRFHLYITCEANGGWTSEHFTGIYRAVSRAELTDVATASGFSSIRWVMAEESGFHQPIMLAIGR